MNDNGFKELTESLEEAIRYTWELQDIYREQTGRNFIPPFRLSEHFAEAQRQLDRDEARNRTHKSTRESGYDFAADGSRRM